MGFIGPEGVAAFFGVLIFTAGGFSTLTSFAGYTVIFGFYSDFYFGGASRAGNFGALIFLFVTSGTTFSYTFSTGAGFIFGLTFGDTDFLETTGCLMFGEIDFFYGSIAFPLTLGDSDFFTTTDFGVFAPPTDISDGFFYTLLLPTDITLGFFCTYCWPRERLLFTDPGFC